MRHLALPIETALITALVLSLSSCLTHKPQTVKAAPPPPAPAAVPAAAPPPQPLSIPQTEVHLPPPQPVSPEAAASAQPPEEVPHAAPPAPRPVSRPRAPAATRPETPVPTPAAPPAAEPERPPLQEVLPAAEQKRFQEEAAGRRREVRQLVDPLDRRRLSRQQRALLDRIQSFLKQSDDAERQGEMRQASELAQRALVLARELKP